MNIKELIVKNLQKAGALVGKNLTNDIGYGNSVNSCIYMSGNRILYYCLALMSREDRLYQIEVSEKMENLRKFNSPIFKLELKETKPVYQETYY